MSERIPMGLEVQGLMKDYVTGPEKVAVLRNVSFSIPAGERIAVVGRSGAGKSTLLNILGTLDAPTAGSVLYGGQDVFARKARALARFRNENLGFIFQFHHLLPEFTAIENVMMPSIVARAPRAQAHDRAKEVLSLVGLAGRLEHKPGELSGGERQRVAVARAIVTRPSVVLADEPTGNLDRKTSEGIHTLLEKLNAEEGITLVVVTHDLNLAARMQRQIRLIGGQSREEEPGHRIDIDEEATLSPDEPRGEDLLEKSAS